MRPVTHDYQSLNEYTLPLQGKPYYRSSGIIYAVDRNGNKYAVGQVDLERFDDQNFQYVFTPEWSVIDTLPSSIFQGIPGLDMSMRLERYYRVNMTPYFISERTLSPAEIPRSAIPVKAPRTVPKTESRIYFRTALPPATHWWDWLPADARPMSSERWTMPAPSAH